MEAHMGVACANANLAFVKYWGNINDRLRLPSNGSISMTLGGLRTRTRVSFSEGLGSDTATVGGVVMADERLERISRHLDAVRRLAGVGLYAEVSSENNFPSDAGVASSASAFAALALAATSALGMSLSERELSCLARLGSGSAARSVPGGFVEWHASEAPDESYAETIAPASHWDLTDLVAIVDRTPKGVGSTKGHQLAATSEFQRARVQNAPVRLTQCREAILQRDFHSLAAVAELDSNEMHAVMMTSSPPLFYWQPATLAVMIAIMRWRAEGIEVLYTVDAGPNVHCVCAPGYGEEVRTRLGKCGDVQEVLKATPGEGARICT